MSPGDVAVEVHAVVEGVHEAVGRGQGGEGVLGVVRPVGELHHGPRVVADVLLEGPAGRAQARSKEPRAAVTVKQTGWLTLVLGLTQYRFFKAQWLPCSSQLYLHSLY